MNPLLLFTFLATYVAATTPSNHTINLVQVNPHVVFRDHYNPNLPVARLAECVSNYTDKLAIIDANDVNPTLLSFWVDTGSNQENDLDAMLITNITDCVRRVTGIDNVFVHNHNSYATIGSYDSDGEYYQHFGYFGHGEPLNYDKDYDSYGDPDADAQSNYKLSERGTGNWPDRVVPWASIHWLASLAVDWYSNKNQKDHQGSREGYSCGQCYSISGALPKSIQFSNDNGYEADIMVWLHHDCRSKSAANKKNEKSIPGAIISVRSEQCVVLNQKVGSFWIQCQTAEGWPDNDLPQNKGWSVAWI